MNRDAKGSISGRRTRKSLKELGYSLLGVVLVIVLIGFVICMKIGTFFISPLVSIVRCVVRK